MELQQRKRNRLTDYNYSSNGIYFLTFCTYDRKKILCEIFEDEQSKEVTIKYSKIGHITKEEIEKMINLYDDVTISKYVIMPNHIHLLLEIGKEKENEEIKNSIVSQFISTVKRFINKKAGVQLWQRGYYDHIVRNESDYLKIWEYIDNNPLKWSLDKYYDE